MKQKLIHSLQNRIKTEIPPKSPLRWLEQLDISEHIDSIISIVYLYTRPKRGTNITIFFAELISALGHSLRSGLKKDSSLAAKTGAFVLYTFEEAGFIKVRLGQGTRGHNAYVVEVVNDDGICDLWAKIDSTGIEKIPSEVPYKNWDSTRHESGAYLIKTGCREVLEKVTPESVPIVFDIVNKAQHVGWRINPFIYELFPWALRNKADAFADIWDQHSAEARSTKLREVKAIGSIAKMFIGKTFYHRYFLDFRGRKYCATAYLHEQGCDLAKGLLLRDEKKAIGEHGYFWLMVSIASNWAGDAGREDGLKTDKIPLEDRYFWSVDNKEVLLSYAVNPKVNQGWMKAEKPWQFLAACHEYLMLHEWQITEEIRSLVHNYEYDPYAYESHLECYVDGSNNGSQHLSALTLDEITAPYVNLVPSELPGDLYKYVADQLWNILAKEMTEKTHHEIKEAETLIDNLIELKKQINAAELRSERKKVLMEELRVFREAHKEKIKAASVVFWSRITDAKQRRKVSKRGTMTLSYGATPYGMGEQVISDAKKHGIELLYYMEHSWGAHMGRLLYATCEKSLERPMRLLHMFEAAGKAAEEENRFLSWTVPVTNFPVVQHYTEGTVKKIYIQYGKPIGERLNTGYFENTYQVAICHTELQKPSKRKQSQGASPNIIHSLDAAHLAMVVHQAPFPVTTVHDSFGCLLSDMPELFHLLRTTFVELYASDPLTHIVTCIKGAAIEKGSLDLDLVLDSEYCFA